VYVRGHLLNHHVHGPGENRNLVPITGSCNTTMETQAEHVIKKAVIGEGKVVRFIAKAKGKQGPRKYIPQESELPEKLVLNAVELEEGSDGKWKTEGKSLLKDKEIPNTLPKDEPVGTVHIEVNLSTARRAQIDTIDGIGPVLADRIVKLRNKLGRPFHTYDDLIGADGIGEDTVDRLRNNKWVKLH
jgi:DNA uptake protein ComE-like DNA-binding protein